LAPAFGVGLASAEETKDKATGKDKAEGKAKPAKGDGEAKQAKGAVLSIVVMGGGRRIGQAEVQVKFPADSGVESMLLTDGGGSATFKAAGPGKARVRVIAQGWRSALQEVSLKEGEQQVTITLAPLAGNKK
jgi:hypothetical protein